MRPSILRGITLGIAASVILLLYLYRFEGFSRWVFLTDSALLSILLVGTRILIVRADEYLRRQQSRGLRVLVYGAGRGGSLLVRELSQNEKLHRRPFGIIDDDPAKRRLKIEGVPVMGGLADLPALLERHEIAEVVVAIGDLGTAQSDVLSGLCREHGVPLSRMRFVLTPMETFEPASPAHSGHGR